MISPMFPLYRELRELFGEQVHSILADHGDEIYILMGGPDVRPIVQHLRSRYESRVVAVFAEDRRSMEGVFFNYYVLEQRGNPGFLILQAPVPADNPEFPSLSAELPALNGRRG